MPELHLERRQGTPWWVWALVALVAALLIWGIVELVTPERRAEQVVPQEQVAGERQVTGERATDAQPMVGSALPVIGIVTAPNDHLGRTVSGTAMVADVVSDRGFWLEDDGQRLFAIVDEPRRETIDINTGMRLQLTGTVMDANRAANMPGIRDLEAQTRQILDQQSVFLVVDADQIRVEGAHGAQQP